MKKKKELLYMEDVPRNSKSTIRRLLSLLGRQRWRLVVVI